MSENMIDRVAEAIEKAVEQRTDGSHTMTFSTPEDREGWRRARAVAAIEAMLEPTEEMIDAACCCERGHTVGDALRDEYKAMIDAALSTPDNDKT